MRFQNFFELKVRHCELSFLFLNLNQLQHLLHLLKYCRFYRNYYFILINFIINQFQIFADVNHLIHHLNHHLNHLLDHYDLHYRFLHLFIRFLMPNLNYFYLLQPIK